MALGAQQRKLTVAGVLVVHACLLQWSALRHSPTFDETAHLPAGIWHWERGRFDLYRVNPPLVRMIAALPVMASSAKTDWSRFRNSPGARPEFAIGYEFIEANGYRSFWFFTLARWVCIPFSLAGAYVCYRWARELYGDFAGLTALVLWCFSPNILANAALITTDAAAAALGVSAAYAYWRWLKEPTGTSVLVAGLAFGLAQLAKMTWLILFVLWPLIWFCDRWLSREELAPREWLNQAGQLAGILVLGLWFLNSGYGFEGTFRRLGDYRFVSQSLSGKQTAEIVPGRMETGNRFDGTWMQSIPMPLPRNYVLGLDVQKRDFEGAWPVYLHGDIREGGWWYYYLYGLGVKTPIGIWLLAGLWLFDSRKDIRFTAGGALLVGIFLTVLILVSVQHSVAHFRYLLPAFPFVFILLSKPARAFEPDSSCGRGAVVATAVGLLLLSSLWVFPHSGSYFNVVVGGPRRGHAHMVGSEIDWGQDLLYLKRWLERHPEAEPLSLAYAGNCPVEVAGITCTLPPPHPDSRRVPLARLPRESGPQPGWHAVSVNLVAGMPTQFRNRNGRSFLMPRNIYTYFQHFQPVATAGYSIYIYHITLDEANRERREMGLPEVEEGG